MKREKKRYILLAVLLILILWGCKKEGIDEGQEDSNKANTSVGEASGELGENQVDQEDKGKEETSNGTADEKAEDSEVSQRVEVSITEKEVVIYQTDFEDVNEFLFVPRGAEKVGVTTELAYEGSQSLMVSDRTETWNGAKIDLSEELTSGHRYKVSAWVRYDHGETVENRIYCKVEKNSNEYLNCASVMSKCGEWTYLEGQITIPEGTETASFYFETEYKSGATKDDLVDFYVDNITISEVVTEIGKEELPSLYKFYEDYFFMGVAIGANDLTEESVVQLITKQFNSITMGNEMKPDSILDYNTCSSNPELYNENPALNYERLDIGLTFAKEHGLKMRSHTLVWHSQTPRWFFAEGYSSDANAPLVSKEVMIKRMESYIKQVLEYTEENYPGVIYCWDVVNEAIQVSDGEDGGYRSSDSYWYQTIGPEFVELAFTYARAYGNPEVKLFYNDYNTYEKEKLFAIYDLALSLKEKGLIDGIGMQSHIQMEYPSIIDYEYAIKKLGELGLEIQITELDIDLEKKNDEEFLKQGKRYRRIFDLYKRCVDGKVANITSVTVWGISDDRSWLNDDIASYPLLFDKYLLSKDAFWGVIGDPSVPLY